MIAAVVQTSVLLTVMVVVAAEVKEMTVRKAEAAAKEGALRQRQRDRRGGRGRVMEGDECACSS